MWIYELTRITTKDKIKASSRNGELLHFVLYHAFINGSLCRYVRELKLFFGNLFKLTPARMWWRSGPRFPLGFDTLGLASRLPAPREPRGDVRLSSEGVG